METKHDHETAVSTYLVESRQSNYLSSQAGRARAAVQPARAPAPHRRLPRVAVLGPGREACQELAAELRKHSVVHISPPGEVPDAILAVAVGGRWRATDLPALRQLQARRVPVLCVGEACVGWPPELPWCVADEVWRQLPRVVRSGRAGRSEESCWTSRRPPGVDSAGSCTGPVSTSAAPAAGVEQSLAAITVTPEKWAAAARTVLLHQRQRFMLQWSEVRAARDRPALDALAGAYGVDSTVARGVSAWPWEDYLHLALAAVLIVSALVRTVGLLPGLAVAIVLSAVRIRQLRQRHWEDACLRLRARVLEQLSMHAVLDSQGSTHPGLQWIKRQRALSEVPQQKVPYQEVPQQGAQHG